MLFPDSLSRKNCIIFLFFSVGTVTNPAILLVINAVQIFLSLPTGTISLARAADYIPSFFAILHNYISFCRLGNIFRQIILKKIKPINNLLILNFSPSNHLGRQPKNLVLKSTLVANKSLNGLTRGLKTVCDQPKPSLEVTQKVKAWSISLQLKLLMAILFIIYLNSLKQFVHWTTVSVMSYTSNTLSVSRCKSVQI